MAAEAVPVNPPEDGKKKRTGCRNAKQRVKKRKGIHKQATPGGSLSAQIIPKKQTKHKKQGKGADAKNKQRRRGRKMQAPKQVTPTKKTKKTKKTEKTKKTGKTGKEKNTKKTEKDKADIKGVKTATGRSATPKRYESTTKDKPKKRPRTEDERQHSSKNFLSGSGQRH